MKPLALFVVVSLASLLGSLPAVAASEPENGSKTGDAAPLVVEDFSATRLGQAWTWLREERSGWRLGDGQLSIRTDGQLWGADNDQRNVLLHAPLADPQAPVAVELTVDAGLALTDRYEHGGLVWYLDDDHWVTLTQLNHVQDGTQKIMLVHEVGGRGQSGTARAVPYALERVELRLERRGHRFEGLFRPPGDTAWTRLGSIDFDGPGTVPRMGIVAGQGRASLDHWIRFDDFRILRLAP